MMISKVRTDVGHRVMEVLHDGGKMELESIEVFFAFILYVSFHLHSSITTKELVIII